MRRLLYILLGASLAALGAGAQTVLVPTRPAGDNSNAAASTAFVQSAVAPVVNAITGLTGDVVATGPGSVSSTIQPGVVTSAKMAAGAAATNVGTLSGVLTGTLPAPGMAAGAASTNVGSLGGSLTGTLPNPTVAAGVVTNSMLANMAADTVKCNNTGSAAAPTDCTTIAVAGAAPQITLGANGGNSGEIAFNGSTAGQAVVVAGPNGGLTISPAATKVLAVTDGPTNGTTLAVTGVGGAIANQVTINAAAAAASPFLQATGTDTNIILTLKGTGTGGVATLGTSTNDSAAAGYVGELITATQGAAQNLTIGTAINTTSISLTPGDWDVNGECLFPNTNNITSTTSSLALFCSVSTTSATLDQTDVRVTNVIYPALSAGLVAVPRFNVGASRFSVSSNTTVNLVMLANGGGTITFGSGTNIQAQGTIRARRER